MATRRRGGARTKVTVARAPRIEPAALQRARGPAGANWAVLVGTETSDNAVRLTIEALPDSGAGARASVTTPADVAAAAWDEVKGQRVDPRGDELYVVLVLSPRSRADGPLRRVSIFAASEDGVQLLGDLAHVTAASLRDLLPLAFRLADTY
jgi:hypothetical protein